MTDPFQDWCDDLDEKIVQDYRAFRLLAWLFVASLFGLPAGCWAIFG